MAWTKSAGLALLATAASVRALDLVTTDEASLAHAGFVVSHGMMSYYSGNESGQAPGYLPGEGQADGYYWWEGAGVFGSLIDYWYYTGDDTYNDVTTQAITWQMGSDRNFQPENASQTLGNDDIGFWAISALKAAEMKFPNPPSNDGQWIPVVQTVFNNFVSRWDPKTCGGGLRWQVFPLASGYSYKNSVSNGAFFNIAARLGKYTGNQTYFDWAEKVYDWSNEIGLIDQKSFVVYDGTSVTNNCSDHNQNPWSYNSGLYIYGAAAMYNVTGAEKWKTGITNLLNGFGNTFVRDGVVTEVGCQDTNTCNNDEKSFKSYMMIWLNDIAKVANFTAPTVLPWLTASGTAAAKSCSGSTDGVTCGLSWNEGKWDGSKGIGEQMCALQAFNALMGPFKAGPIQSFKDGGLSVSDPNAGSNANDNTDPSNAARRPITGGDQAGAGIITFLLIVTTIGGSLWMVFDDPVRWVQGFRSLGK